MGELTDSLIEAIPQLIDAAISIILGLSEFIINNLDTIIETAIEVVIALATGLIGAAPELMMATPKLIKAIVDVFIKTNWGKVGLDLVKGIAKGIVNGVGAAVKAAKNMASSVWRSITNVFDMKSPSRLALRVFQKDFVEKGIGDGILRGIPEVVRDTKRMSESIIGVIKDVPSMDILPKMRGITPANSLSGASGNISNSYSGGDIVIQNMNINSKENAQYFAEYLYSLKKTRNRTVGMMT